jgi:hypothetical protein
LLRLLDHASDSIGKGSGIGLGCSNSPASNRLRRDFGEHPISVVGHALEEKAMSENEQVPSEIQEMFVQVAQEAMSTGETLTLKGVGRSTLYFADRPERVVGHISKCGVCG